MRRMMAKYIEQTVMMKWPWLLFAPDTAVPYWRIFWLVHDGVCGAVVSMRAKGDKIVIWTTECENRCNHTHKESIQGRVRTSSDGSDWLSVPHRHNYKKWIHH